MNAKRSAGHDARSTSIALLSCCFCVSGEEVCRGLWADQREDHGAPGGAGEAEEAGRAHRPVGGRCHRGNPRPRVIRGNGMSSKKSLMVGWVATQPLAFPF